MKYHVKIDEKVYEVEITDLRARPIIAIVDGVQIEVMPENADRLLPAGKTQPEAASQPVVKHSPAPLPTGTPTGGSVGGNVVRAPIPGNIIAISVKVGDEVNVGQELCILEAMKMRNSIRAGRSGKIGAVLVAVGKTVNHSDPLFEFAE